MKKVWECKLEGSMYYKGVIIEESLSNNEIVHELEIIETYIGETTVREATPWLDKWTLQTVIIPEDKIEMYSKRLSELIDKKHISTWYCDFRNNKYHYVIFSDKVFKLDRTSKKDYLEMRYYGKKIGIPANQLPNFNDLPENLLVGFLIEAKKQTYANIDAPKFKSSRNGSNDYHYEEEIEGEKMIYHDTYFGGTKFMGEEVVYRGSDIPKWGMNYYGVTIDDNLSEEAMDKALRPALMKVGEDNSVLPIRGPSKFENDGYIYIFKTNGDIGNFTGEEEIYKNDKLVYKLVCHGGIIEK